MAFIGHRISKQASLDSQTPVGVVSFPDACSPTRGTSERLGTRPLLEQTLTIRHACSVLVVNALDDEMCFYYLEPLYI